MANNESVSYTHLDVYKRQVEAGADLRAVQEMMGHKSITTTEIYTHLDKGYLRNTLEQFHPRYNG